MADADPHLKDRLLNDLSSSVDSSGPAEPIPETPDTPPVIPDHTLLRRIGRGSYGEVWLARNVMGTPRAVKIVRRRAFDSNRPYEREFAGIRRFEPVSRTHPSQLHVLHVGRDDAVGYF
jgi:serine/threonine protein kinase